MKYQNTFEIITKDIQDIEKLVGNFNNYSSIPLIEIDLALSKLRNIYELLLIFREVDNEAISEDAENIPKPKVEIPYDKNDPEMEEDTEIFSFEESEMHATEAIPSDTPDAVETTKTGAEEIHDKEVLNEEKKIPKKDSILSERFTSDKLYINEKLREQTVKSDIKSKIQSSPIKTIAGSIGINDKFYFIRELFNGNPEHFRNSMEILDHALNFNEAYNYLIEQFDWDMESEPVQQLLSLIRRKFISTGHE